MNNIPVQSQQLNPTSQHSSMLSELNHLRNQRTTFAKHDEKVAPFKMDDIITEPYLNQSAISTQWLRYGTILLIILLLAFFLLFVIA